MAQDHDSSYPSIVKAYRQRYDRMFKREYRQEFLHYAKSVLRDPFDSLDWKELLEWEHNHFKYTKGKLPKPRAELPIDILLQTGGRCGEFALLYNGLLLANHYQTRLVVDCSQLRDNVKEAAGDHVWVEVLLNDVWVHVDPTERKIDKPLMYALEWRKDVNLVYAISEEEIVDVTKTYSVQ